MRYFIPAAFLLLLGACQTAPKPDDPNAYRLRRSSRAAIKIDGKLDEKAWRSVPALTRFTDPWRAGASPTVFQAFCDRTTFYFAFTAHDDTPRVEAEWRGENTLDDEDRVELYFALDDRLEKYYCIEMDPKGRVHDFLGSYPRRWDNDWTMPGLQVAGQATPQGYIVEGSIPLSALQTLGLPSGQPWRVGLFRADLAPKGDDSVYWVTWIDPHTAKPDFHTPTAFGRFIPPAVNP